MEWLQPRFSVVIDEADFLAEKREDPRAYLEKIEVVAKGQTFQGKARHPKGGWYSEEFRNTDEELVNKFISNASQILTSNKANKAAQTILQLEKLETVDELMKTLCPESL